MYLHVDVCFITPNTIGARWAGVVHIAKNLAAFEEATNRLLMRQIIQLLQENDMPSH